MRSNHSPSKSNPKNSKAKISLITSPGSNKDYSNKSYDLDGWYCDQRSLEDVTGDSTNYEKVGFGEGVYIYPRRGQDIPGTQMRQAIIRPSHVLTNIPRINLMPFTTFQISSYIKGNHLKTGDFGGKKSRRDD
ncbi:hypothetical protein TNCV_4945261 [Trichonephila clavipes]|nr:hypothetical protein TNCV_4945261 [Trichonephila clavipes]